MTTASDKRDDARDEAAAEKAKLVKARVLTRTHFDGEWHEVDSIIEAPADTIKALAANGEVDPHPDAVKHAQPIHDARLKSERLTASQIAASQPK